MDLQWVAPKFVDWDAVFARKMIANRYYIRRGLCRKDDLATNLQEWAARHTEEDILEHVPLTVVGQDSEEFWHRVATAMEQEPGVWILKPADSSNATDITVFKDLDVAQGKVAAIVKPRMVSKGGEKVEGVRNYVVQKYIERPLLVQGRKFHIRAWALAQGSVNVYLHENALCLCATKQFQTEDLTDNLVHLTNGLSVQSKAQDYVFEENALSLAELGEHLRAEGHAIQDPQGHIFAQMQRLVRAAFASVVDSRRKFFLIAHCFEYFGLDFLVDEHLKVWLLEVNACADLSGFNKHYEHLAKGVLEDIIALCIDPIFPPYCAKPQPSGFHLVFQEVIDQLDSATHINQLHGATDGAQPETT